MGDDEGGGGALAYWATGPGRGELRPCRLGAPGAGEVRVRARFSGVSRGTEALVAAGRVPASQREAMRAPFQEGEFPFPVKHGYASVGRVEAGEPGLVGREVFCLFPHQDAYVVPAAAVAPLPEGVPAARAVLAANLETALNGVWDAGALPGERVLVVGGGVVGLLAAWLCGRLPGAEVTVCDTDPGRAALAAALGVGFAAPDAVPGAADRVLHCSGSAAGLRTALAAAGFEARVVELSWHGSAEVALPLGEAFHSRRLRLVSSQVGEVAPAVRPRWSRARRLAKALELLRGADELDTLVAETVAFAELPTVLPRLPERRGALCLRVVYSN